MSSIIVLDEITANRIAAGEVVERPASVVKELVENAIDAGSSRILVDIKGGGLEEIKVLDNGCGMDGDDAAVAFCRHATSKISSACDIEKITTLGFRGEALPSIASVSRTVMTTRTSDSHSGVRIEIHGGRPVSKSLEACPQGTSVVVCGLFYNTPARLKHMKSRSTEISHIIEIVSRLALARPEVNIKLASEGKTLYHSPGAGDLKNALAAVVGPDTAEKMLYLEGEDYGIRITGFISHPSVLKSSPRSIFTTVNGRPVRHHLVNAALLEGYGTLIPAGRYPLAAITLEVPLEKVDVNVHPAKQVVKISEENMIFSLVKRTVIKTLGTSLEMPLAWAPAMPPSIHVDSQYGATMNSGIRQIRDMGEVMHENSDSCYRNSFNNNIESSVRILFENARYLGFLPPAYILATGSTGLLVIDQHAAHERILYESILNEWLSNGVEVQFILLPPVIWLEPGEYQLAMDNRELLLSLGIHLSFYDDGNVAVTGVPSLIPQSGTQEFLQDILDCLVTGGKDPDREGIIKKAACSAACTAAIKAGERSDLETASALIESLAKTQMPYACPHGRPTMFEITENELKTRFKRT